MAKQSSVNLDITNNPDGFDISGGTVVRKLGITGGDVTIAGSGSAVITFPTTSTTIAGLSITQSFSALQSFSSGLSAAGGVTLSSNVTIPSGSTFTVNGNFIANGNVNLGDAITDAITVTGLLAANGGLSAAGGTFSGTQTFINGAIFQGNITAPNIVTSFNGLTGSVTGVTTGTTNTFVALQSFTTGISAAGTTAATFSGTVNCNSSTVYKPTLQYYNEPTSSPSISSNVLTLDLSAAQMFTVSLNANINTFTISNTPATSPRAMSFTLIFTADGTARTVTWGSSVKWANGTAPVLTSTNTKKDVFTFMTTDAGTSWLGFVAGQNF
jgi:hypothetical protein